MFFDIQPYIDELNDKQSMLSKDEKFIICRIVDNSFLFLKHKEESMVTDLKIDTSLNIQYTGQKIYLFPPTLNKGKALHKLKAKFNPEFIFAAGDSKIDIPMLNLVDIAYISNTLSKMMKHDRYINFDSAESILKDIIDQTAYH